MEATFFPTPGDFRKWLEANHASSAELLVGYYKKHSGIESITWPESVDQALCFGWIDGVRRRIDDLSYSIRFTPRRSGSIWSAVNIDRARFLIDCGQMRPTGLAAFEARLENKSGIYAYEQRKVELEEPYASIMNRNPAASDFFNSQPASYRKVMCWWILSAKREETRLKRLDKLIEMSAAGERMR